VQNGLLPLSIASIQQAIRLNGTFVEGNLRTFALGRLAAHQPDALERPAGEALPSSLPTTLDEVVASRMKLLTDYQDARYARTYLEFINGIRGRVSKLSHGDMFVRQVALTLARLMAYKDEYEVARLYTAPAFMKQMRQQFSGNPRMTFHLAPPFLPGRDATGRPKKRAFGPWVLSVFKILAASKRLRGTALDPFGYMKERRAERRLIGEYRALIEGIVERLDEINLAAAVELARAAIDIAGYGLVKDAAAAAYAAKLPGLMAAFETASAQPRSRAA
jgi:indolepyruvate ferredoxin oxidoreductase